MNILDKVLFGTARKAALVATVLAGVFSSSAALQAQTSAESPVLDIGSDWNLYSLPINWELSASAPNKNSCSWDGTPDCGYDSSSQQLTSSFALTIYKASEPVAGNDVYLVKSILGQATTNYQNYGTAVGYFGSNMKLTLSGITPGMAPATLYDASPTSTVGQTEATVGLSIGSSGLQLSASSSYSTPDVNIGASKNASSVTYEVVMPTGGNPGPASTSGYTALMGAIFETPENTGLRIDVNQSAAWSFWKAGYQSVDSVGTDPASASFWVDFQNREIMGTDCLSVKGNLAQAGTPVVESSCMSASGQLWSYTSAFQLQVMMNGRNYCLDTANGQNPTAGAKLAIQACSNSSSSQKWQICTTTHSNGLTQLRWFSGIGGASLVAFGNADSPRTIGSVGSGGIGLIQKPSGQLTVNYSSPDINAYFDVN